jgi:hypothetical protein
VYDLGWFSVPRSISTALHNRAMGIYRSSAYVTVKARTLLKVSCCPCMRPQLLPTHVVHKWTTVSSSNISGF